MYFRTDSRANHATYLDGRETNLSERRWRDGKWEKYVRCDRMVCYAFDCDVPRGAFNNDDNNSNNNNNNNDESTKIQKRFFPRESTNLLRKTHNSFARQPDTL